MEPEKLASDFFHEFLLINLGEDELLQERTLTSQQVNLSEERRRELALEDAALERMRGVL